MWFIIKECAFVHCSINKYSFALATSSVLIVKLTGILAPISINHNLFGALFKFVWSPKMRNMGNQPPDQTSVGPLLETLSIVELPVPKFLFAAPAKAVLLFSKFYRKSFTCTLSTEYLPAWLILISIFSANRSCMLAMGLKSSGLLAFSFSYIIF